jgi:heat shock protein 1/8
VDAHQIDTVVFVGGAGCLPGLQNAVLTQTSSTGLREDVEVADADPTEVVAIACALQADLLARLHTEDDKDAGMLLRSVHDGAEKHKDERVHSEAAVLSRTLGVLFPDAKAENKELGGEWVPLLRAETALPARRTVEVEVLAGVKTVGVEVWEAHESIKVTKETVEREKDDDDDDDGKRSFLPSLIAFVSL